MCDYWFLVILEKNVHGRSFWFKKEKEDANRLVAS